MNHDQPRGEHRGYGRGGPRGGQGGGGHDSRERRGVPLSDLDPQLTDTSRKVIGCAIDVHRTLGPGYGVDIYRSALVDELKGVAVNTDPDARLDVVFKGKKLGTIAADLFVEKKFIVTVLARPGEVTSFERSQLRAQLKAANVDLGLIINFGERRLKDGLVRVLNIGKINADKGITGHEDDGYEEESGEPGSTVGFS